MELLGTSCTVRASCRRAGSSGRLASPSSWIKAVFFVSVVAAANRASHWSSWSKASLSVLMKVASSEILLSG